MVTLKDVAKKANVSVATVSNVLNNKKGRVSEETRAQIIKLANEMGYVTNLSARQLVTQKSNTIGIVVPSLSNYFFSSVVTRIQSALHEKNYILLMTISNDSVENDLKGIQYLISRGVEAIVMAASNHARKEEARYIEAFDKVGGPIIMVDRVLGNFEGPKIRFDDQNGMYDLTSYVINQGHRKIAFVDGDYSTVRIHGRLHGFKKAMEAHNVEVDESLIFPGDYSFETGYKIAPDVLNSKPSAVMLANDMMAYGFIKYLIETNQSHEFPVSITGYDDVVFSQMTHPTLTTVSQNIDAMVNEVLKMLERVLEGDVPNEDVIIPTQVIIRESVKKI